MASLDRVNEVFADARALHEASLERLAAGDVRDAAEKDWGATKRATDALILARFGIETEPTPETSSELNRLARLDPRAQSLVARYYTRMGSLHGKCFYIGLCHPMDRTERRIRETAAYIVEAEYLATPEG